MANKLTKSILPLHYIADWVNNFELMWTQWLKLEHLDQDSNAGDSDSSTGDFGLDPDLRFSDLTISLGEIVISPFYFWTSMWQITMEITRPSDRGVTNPYYFEAPSGDRVTLSLCACVCVFVLHAMFNIYVGSIRNLHTQITVTYVSHISAVGNMLCRKICW